MTNLSKDFGNGKKGVDTLKAFLKIDNNVDLINGLNPSNGKKFGDPRVNSNIKDTTNVRDGTDITLGFEAAKAAMTGTPAPQATKEHQFFIFIQS